MPIMTSKKKVVATLPRIPKKLIDQIVSGPMDAEEVNAASIAFKKALIEHILGAELSHHLGYPPGADKPSEIGNYRNGPTCKTVLTEEGPLRLDVLAYRFAGDKFCQAQRFAAYEQALGPRFKARVLPDSVANFADAPPFFQTHVPFAHSVVTVHLVDKEGEPTVAAREEILGFLAGRLM